MTAEMELTLLAHCAPTLAGLKSGNLVRMLGSCEQIEQAVMHWNQMLGRHGVQARILRRDEKSAQVYVYRAQRLLEDWKKNGAAEFLACRGYGMDVEENLTRLSQRLCECPCFPHEIGLFLSYPLEDVQGFIDNCGRNYCLCGCWKVYGDPEAAQKCFDRYRKCSEVYVKCYHKGHTLDRLTVTS